MIGLINPNITGVRHKKAAFIKSERIPDSILLTGDGGLRTVATNHQIEVHGGLWAIDETHKAATATINELIAVLELFESNPTIFGLPDRDLKIFIRRLQIVKYKQIKFLTPQTYADHSFHRRWQAMR